MLERRTGRLTFRGRGALPWRPRWPIGRKTPYERHALQDRTAAVAAIPSGDAPCRYRGTGGGGSAEERRERSNGCGYLIKPRDIQANLRRPGGHWVPRHLLPADRR